MFSEDQETLTALNALGEVVQRNRPPLVIWLGAGVSAWAGYPLWAELAATMHRRFSRELSTYAKNTGSGLLAAESYLKLFQLMRNSDPAFYRSCLLEAFAYRKPTPVYERLLRALERAGAISIVTTNVDESLEHHLRGRETIQRSDVERIPRLLTEGRTFIGKLHGSISSVETMVFSEQDYNDVKRDEPFLNALRSVFAGASVLFLGYSLQDRHVIAALHDSSATHPLFGTGPHFIVTPEGSSEIPSNVKRISYVVDPPDHRSAVLTVEAVADMPGRPRSTASTPPPNEVAEQNKETICFIGDLLPFGKVTTSQTLTAASASGTRELLVGEGYVDGEVVLHDYSALHDLVVGLVCFDVICLSLGHLGRLHQLLGGTFFWAFAEAGAIRLINPPSDPVVVFREPGALAGEIRALKRGSKASSMESFKEMTVSEKISEKIRQHLTARPGKEEEAERQMDMLESSMFDLARVLTTEQLAEKTRSAIMHPSIRRLLGISGGTPQGVVPRWLAFPVLRLAGVVRRGVICQQIKASATRMVLGSEKLASVVFSASEATVWVDDAASYVLTGRFNSDLGALIERPPSPARAPDVRGWTVVSRRSSELVPQFEGEGHGNQLSVAVPHQLCAGRVALASEPPAEAPDQTDSVAEARRRRQLA